MKTKDIIAEMLSLPIEQRAIVADELLKSLNPPEAEIDNKWFALAKQRLDDINSSKVKPINGEDVFQKIKKRFTE
jgi:hypothetical protein